jgi:hypothetical protein
MTEGLYLQPINIIKKSICVSTMAEFKRLQDKGKKYSFLMCFCRPLTNLTSSFSVKHSILCRLISTQDVTTFWTKFREIFSPQREKLWDGLLIGLQRYHRILEGMP